jgi:hypothetical protein
MVRTALHSQGGGEYYWRGELRDGPHCARHSKGGGEYHWRRVSIDGLRSACIAMEEVSTTGGEFTEGWSA